MTDRRPAPDRLTLFKEETMNIQFVAGVQRFIRDEEGAAAVEYGLLAALIAVVVAVAVSTIGNRLCETFKTVATRLGGGSNISCTGPLTA
jgi:pilus assembly protein Flp/PilA